MHVREELERILLGWNQIEIRRGAQPIVDYDCAPDGRSLAPVQDRLDAIHQLHLCGTRAEREGELGIAAHAYAHASYARALLGERQPLAEYVKATQGCDAAGWPEDYVDAIGQKAIQCLSDLGLPWNAQTEELLLTQEGLIEPASAPEQLRAIAADLLPGVRAHTGTQAQFALNIEQVDVDAYWTCWLDGAGHQVRLRINTRRARLTPVLLRRFALHELLAHGLQSASWAAAAQDPKADQSWPRLLAVHALTQVGLEGLAQALPLIVTPNDQQLAARIRLDHYTQLVRAELHLAINAGYSISDCAAHARARVPFWDDAAIADLLADRSVSPQLRSYLWSYPAGIDWFIHLADHADPSTQQAVLHAIYRKPPTPTDLSQLWPSGPPIGGPGAPIRLRHAAVS